MTRVQQQLIDNNKNFQQHFVDGGKPLQPAKKIIILTCMDPRVNPEAFLGLDTGDAAVIRNAGGRAQDALRSLVVAQALSKHPPEIIVIHHSDCGMLRFENKDVYNAVEKSMGAAAGEAARSMDYLPFKDAEASLREDIGIIKASPVIDDRAAVHGYMYDVKSGAIVAVE